MDIQDTRRELKALLDEPNSEIRDKKEEILFNILTFQHRIRIREQMKEAFPGLDKHEKRAKSKIRRYTILLDECVNRFNKIIEDEQ